MEEFSSSTKNKDGKDRTVMSVVCMNENCGVSLLSSADCTTKGWPLRSAGKFATLCFKCGDAYKQFVFCDLFHSEESGWRECISCGKYYTLQNNKDSKVSALNAAGENQLTSAGKQTNLVMTENVNLVQCGDDMENTHPPQLLPSEADNVIESPGQTKVEEGFQINMRRK